MMKLEIENVKIVSISDSWKKIKRGTLLVDVREKEEVEKMAFDVPNVLNIPISEFEERFIELPKDENLILASANGNGSRRAGWFLMDQGYDKLASMEFGMKGWIQKKLPVKVNHLLL